jgi:hypothetical protein
MIVKHYAQGKYYLIACPNGSRLVHRSEQIAPDGHFLADLLVVPFGDKEIAIPVEPPGLLPLLAESGRCGLSLVGEPRPDMSLEGASCPSCGQSDVSWLSAAGDTGRIHCDSCGSSFERSHGMSRSRPSRGRDSPDDTPRHRRR